MFVRQDRGMLAVLIMLDVGFHSGRSNTVSAADIAERAGLARRGIEPLLQTLSRSGLLDSVRGPKGGYRLGRPRRDILLSDIFKVALSEDLTEGEGPAGEMFDQVIAPLWGELDAVLLEKLVVITLDDLTKRAEAAGLARPAAEPITFSI